MHNPRGWYPAGKADLDAVLAANREAVRVVPAEPPSTARAQVLMGYGRALHIQAGRYEEAAAVHEQALTAARRAGSQPDIARAMAAWATCGRSPARWTPASPCCGRPAR